MKAHNSNPLFRGVAMYMAGNGTVRPHNGTHNPKKNTPDTIKRRL